MVGQAGVEQLTNVGRFKEVVRLEVNRLCIEVTLAIFVTENNWIAIKDRAGNVIHVK